MTVACAAGGADAAEDGPRNWRPAGAPGVVFGVGGPVEPLVLGQPITVVLYIRNDAKKPVDVPMVAWADGVARPEVAFLIAGGRLIPPGGRAVRPVRSTVKLQFGEVRACPFDLQTWVVDGNESWTGRKHIRHPRVYWIECCWRWSANQPARRAATRLKFVRTEAAKTPLPQPNAKTLAKEALSVPGCPRIPAYEITYENLGRMLRSDDYEERYSAALHLAGTSTSGWKGTNRQADELTRLALADAFSATRRQGAKFARSRGLAAAAAIPALIEALKSQAGSVRAECVRALGATGALAAAMTRIKKMLAAGDQLEAIAWEFHEFGPPGLAVLKGYTGSDNPKVRLWCAAALARAGHDAGPYVKELKAAITGKQKKLVLSACRSAELAGRSAAGAGAVLAARLTDRDPEIRLAAARALQAAAPTDPVVVKTLIKTIAEKEKDIRGYCLGALGRIGPKAASAIPAIVKLMEADDSARFGALLALAKIDPKSPQALPVLIRLLRRGLDKERAPDEHVIEAIGAYGPAAKPAVGDLVKAMKVRRKHSYHVDKAIWALGQIGPAAIEAAGEIAKCIPGPFAETAQRALKRIMSKDPATMPPPDKHYTGQTLKVDF